MKWGFFTPIHIATLLAAAAMNLGLYYFLKHKSVKVQTLFMLPFSLLGVGAIIFNLLKWGSPLEYLPLHLCSLNALVLPIAVFTRSKALGNLLLAWCLGALAALVVNMAQAEYEIFSLTFVFYFAALFFPDTMLLEELRVRCFALITVIFLPLAFYYVFRAYLCELRSERKEDFRKQY